MWRGKTSATRLATQWWCKRVTCPNAGNRLASQSQPLPATGSQMRYVTAVEATISCATTVSTVQVASCTMGSSTRVTIPITSPIIYATICTRGVNLAEISGPARKFFFRPGPARNKCIIKILLYNFLKYYSKINITVHKTAFLFSARSITVLP